MPQEWLDDRVHLLEADTNVMSLRNFGDEAPARRKRRSWSVEKKRRIVDESLEDGASIAEVARRHGLNANQLFTWRRQFGFEPRDSDPNGPAPILPVMIVADTTASGHGRHGQMEIVLTGGDRIIVWGDVETGLERGVCGEKTWGCVHFRAPQIKQNMIHCLSWMLLAQLFLMKSPR